MITKRKLFSLKEKKKKQLYIYMCLLFVIHREVSHENILSVLKQECCYRNSQVHNIYCFMSPFRKKRFVYCGSRSKKQMGNKLQLSLSHQVYTVYFGHLVYTVSFTWEVIEILLQTLIKSLQWVLRSNYIDSWAKTKHVNNT